MSKVNSSKIRTALATVALLAVSTVSAQAQQGAVVADLMNDVADLQKKLISLANAIPAEKSAWRPADGVRSVNEVLLHVSSDNYLIPASVGFAAPAATGITTDYKTAQAYEQRKLDRAATIAELEHSFAHLNKWMTAQKDANMGAKAKVFGMEMTTQQLLVLATTHLHEHLGQMIAYARMNKIAPPWSQ
jgi:uncharacterized damage-inducible protein DinB